MNMINRSIFPGERPVPASVGIASAFPDKESLDGITTEFLSISRKSQKSYPRTGTKNTRPYPVSLNLIPPLLHRHPRRETRGSLAGIVTRVDGGKD